MKRNTKIDSFEEDTPPEYISMGAVELSDIIEEKINNRGKGRISTTFKNELNKMIDEFNSRFGKTYIRFS